MKNKRYKELIKMIYSFKNITNKNQNIVYELSLEIISNRKDRIGGVIENERYQG
ncbi:hypothetical protein KLN18_15135 [Clostridioides difficile]|uniref:hypothetical protein n=2 Tax=Clostridioides TaxID=1870884 RepID=UPI000A910F54|nr:hypothetical protein [Clostridioides difficile]MDO0132414.1 hypothetical protein [Clostridioides difficile]HBF0312691.1 hypothetical protein [Clostridioides difficile]